MTDPRDIQKNYYARTAAAYDELHVGHDDQHYTALRYIEALTHMLDSKSLLDIGAGTGRSLQYFLERGTTMTLIGVEPVQELIDQATKKGLPDGLIVPGSGDTLPFPNSSIDIVCAFAVMHHVQQPDAILREALRVARQAIFISDANRFGQGPMPLRILKLVAYKLHAWALLNTLKTRGRGYTVTEGDGLAFSYSVFDSYRTLAAWADRVFMIPTERTHASSWLHPLLTSRHVLMCAIRD